MDTRVVFCGKSCYDNLSAWIELFLPQTKHSNKRSEPDQEGEPEGEGADISKNRQKLFWRCRLCISPIPLGIGFL